MYTACRICGFYDLNCYDLCAACYNAELAKQFDERMGLLEDFALVMPSEAANDA